MKKSIALLLSLLLILGITFANAEISQELIDAAKQEGKLVVYGSCEEQYLLAVCQKFEETYGIKTSPQRLSTGEVYAKISEEKGNPSADVWFGGTSDPYSEASKNNLLMPYEPANASNLVSDLYKDEDGKWYGIYKGILGFMCNTEELERMNLPVPQDWDDLLKPEYKGLIWLSNPNTAGTAKVFINTIVQMRGLDNALEYFKALNENIAQYTKSGSGPSKKVGLGECVIGIGFLHDGITQIVDNGYDNISLVVPASGTGYEVGATAIFEGAKNVNAAKLFVEFALSPECVSIASEHGTYSFLVIKDVEQPAVAQQFNLDPNNTIEYNFNDAKENTSKYVEAFFAAVGEDDRFQTK